MVQSGSTTVQAQDQALRALDGIVTQQTMLLTYLDAFRGWWAGLRCCAFRCWFSCGANPKVGRFKRWLTKRVILLLPFLFQFDTSERVPVR